jgi:hypothetical protein
VEQEAACAYGSADWNWFVRERPPRLASIKLLEKEGLVARAAVADVPSDDWEIYRITDKGREAAAAKQ